MATLDLEKEARDLERRIDLAETRPTQMDGRLELITGQQRDVHMLMRARFSDMDEQFLNVCRKLKEHDGRFNRLESKIDAPPRVVAETIAGSRS